MRPPRRELYAIEVALVESAMIVPSARVGSSSVTLRALRSFTSTLPSDNTRTDDMLANSDGDAAVICPRGRTGGSAVCATREPLVSVRMTRTREMRTREWIDMIELQ